MGLTCTVTSIPLANGHWPGGRELDASHLGDIEPNESTVIRCTWTIKADAMAKITISKPSVTSLNRKRAI
jgi:hypothetical protein